MGSKIGAVVLFLLGLGLFGLAATSPASAVSQVRSPSVRWLDELPKPKARPIEAAVAKSAPKAAEPAAEPADKPAAEPAPVQALVPAGDAPSDKPAADPGAAPAQADPAKAVPEAKPAVVALEPAKGEPAAKPAVVALDPAKPGEKGEKKAEAKVAKLEPVPTKATEPAEPKPSLLVQQPEPKPKKLAAAEPKPKAPPAEPAEPQGMGTLVVSSTPPGAEVFLGGANVGQTPIEIDVPTGVHDLKLVDSSGQSKNESVKVRKGRTSKVEVAF